MDRPIFFIGMPRSGTTVIFEAFAADRNVAWPSQHHQRAPDKPALAILSRLADLTPTLRRSVGRSDQRRGLLDFVRIGPTEAYAFWERHCGDRFPYDYLLGTRASETERRETRRAVAKIARYQGKPRFAAKFTGPGRIEYLLSIFPDARFVHIIRDGRAVVRSLMEVPFWRERERMVKPAWANGLQESDLEQWRRHGGSAPVLAAVQWRRVVRSIRAEAERLAPEAYGEIRYERFVEKPELTLDEVSAFCELPPSDSAKDFASTRFELRNMNFQWRDRFDADDVETLNELTGDLLTELGYGVDPPRPPAPSPLVARPFGRS